MSHLYYLEYFQVFIHHIESGASVRYDHVRLVMCNSPTFSIPIQVFEALQLVIEDIYFVLSPCENVYLSLEDCKTFPKYMIWQLAVGTVLVL